MTRNDYFFKILFAIEIALLPLVIFANLLLPGWAVGIFVACVLAVKIWMELFKNKDMLTHTIINALGNVLVLSTLVILFTVGGYINTVLCVFTVILVVLFNLMKVALFGKVMPETIEAVDFCYMLFECLALIAFTFILFNTLVANISIFAIILTSVVSVGYKTYFAIRYTNLISNIKKLNCQ